MLKQQGGEGKEKYKGNKSDASIKQHGGEGGSLGKGGSSKLLDPSAEGYAGPGRKLK